MTLALLVIGATGITSQLVLMRELLTVFLGNELSLGIILACWLALEVLGSWLAGRLKPRAWLFFTAVVVTLLAFPGSIWFCRIARPLLGVTPGETLGPLVMLLIALLTLLPVSLFHGALFTFCVGLSAQQNDKSAFVNRQSSFVIRHSSLAIAPLLGRAYVTETMGSILAGLLLGFLLIGRLGSFQIALLFATLNSLMLVLALRSIADSRKPIAVGREPVRISPIAYRLSSILLLAASLTGFAVRLPALLDHESLARLYPGNEVAYHGDSHYGSITVLRRAGQSTVLSDGTPIATLPVPDYELAEDFVHIPMLSQSNPQHVLLIGGGLSGLLPELLKYPGVTIDYCELDPALLTIARRKVPELAATGLSDPRVSVKPIDGRRFLGTAPVSGDIPRRGVPIRGCPERFYDLIMVHVLSPTSLQTNRYFSQEFFELASSRLKPNGLLVLPAPGSLAYLNDELALLNRLQLGTLRSAFPEVTVVPGEPNLFLAGKTIRPGRFEPETLAARLVRYGFTTRVTTPRHLAERLAPARATDFTNRLKKVGSTNYELGNPKSGFTLHNSDFRLPLNRDQQPVQVLAALSYWAGLTSFRTARWFSGLIRARTWLVLLLITGLVIPVTMWRRRTRFALRFAIFSTGFAGAVASVMILLLFQVAQGTMYLYVVLLTTAFMAGTALGGAWATRLTTQSAVRNSQPPQPLTPDPQSLAADPRPLAPLLRWMYRLEAGIGLIGLLMLLTTSVLTHSSPVVTTAGYVAFAIAAGALLGAEFPLAGYLYLEAGPNPGLGKTAGNLYSADLLGGVLSSLFVPIILVPVIGMLATFLFVALVKLVSLLLLRFAQA
jgi:spermidine synthase